MGREVLLTVLSCVFLKSESVKVINVASPGLLDNVAAASVSRLYRNVPLGVYASNAPYAAYSFQVPSFVAPKANQVPIKEEKTVIQNSHGYLKDSYGNTYHETPQSLAYKTIYPQQYVQLQNLPAHLSQPLGVSPNFQFKQTTPHFFTMSNVPGFSSNPRFTISQPFIYGSNAGSVVSQQLSQALKQQTQQPSNSKDVYVNSHLSENPSESKAHRGEELSTPSYTTAINEHTTKQAQQSSQTKTVPKRQQYEKDVSFVTDVNGQKTVVKIKTKPPLPLLDISLLEPLTFDNPLVPQVQHFLPRIHDATYHKLPNGNHEKKHHKEFVVQNTKTYDTSSPKKSKNETHKKKHKKTKPRKEEDDDDEVQRTPSHKVNGSPNDSPEVSYEINSPNYKETYSEQKVSYNKETESEPVHVNYEKKSENEPISYSYQKHTESKPIHYSYVHDSSKPEQIKETHYHQEEEPKQFVYHFTSNEDDDSHEDSKKHDEERHVSPHTHKEHSYNHAPESNDSGRKHYSPRQNENHNDHKEHHHTNSKHHHPKPEHREHSRPNHENSENHGKFNHYQPVNLEYEEDLPILPKYKQHSDSNDDRQEKHHENKHTHHTKSHKPHFHNTQPSSSPIIHEKSKKIIIKEDSPATDENQEHFMDAMIKQQAENEEDFEKAYKNAAYGFAAYDRPVDVEKEIYNPESYGASNFQTDFDIENSPLAQYHAQGDGFPQDSRSSYKDSNDKMKEEYFLDYAISRPTSILDRYKGKENYFKMFEKQKPQMYFAKPDDKRNNAYTLQPSYSFVMPKKHANAKLTVSPYLYEYDYSKAAPKQDSSAYATQPFQRYKGNTQFVEPQFQYGFEPISIPRLLDSELAAMASNDNIESENPGTRKKIYKENFYIKKTTTAKGR